MPGGVDLLLFLWRKAKHQLCRTSLLKIPPHLKPVNLVHLLHPGTREIVLPEIQEAELVEVVVDDEDIFVYDRADEGVRVEAVGEEVFIYRREVRQDAAQVAVVVGVVVAGQELCVRIIVENLLDRGGDRKSVV